MSDPSRLPSGLFDVSKRRAKQERGKHEKNVTCGFEEKRRREGGGEVFTCSILNYPWVGFSASLVRKLDPSRSARALISECGRYQKGKAISRGKQEESVTRGFQEERGARRRGEGEGDTRFFTCSVLNYSGVEFGASPQSTKWSTRPMKLATLLPYNRVDGVR